MATFVGVVASLATAVSPGVANGAVAPGVAKDWGAADCSAVARDVSTTVRGRKVVADACMERIAEKASQACEGLREGGKDKWRGKNACKVYVRWPGKTDESRRAAVRVAWCEGSLSPDAANGEYRGTFQMGDGERARWGHGPTIESQTIAAGAYWTYSRGFGPWGCAPGTSAEVDKWKTAPAVVRTYG